MRPVAWTGSDPLVTKGFTDFARAQLGGPPRRLECWLTMELPQWLAAYPGCVHESWYLCSEAPETLRGKLHRVLGIKHD